MMLNTLLTVCGSVLVGALGLFVGLCVVDFSSDVH